MNWNDDWRIELVETDYDCYERLCECRNTKADIYKIARIMYKYNQTMSVEDCLDRTLEWLGDWNNQYDLVDISLSEYENLVNRLKAILKR